ncbi:MAG: response regulator [Halobacteriales archaeon]|nr:response regulator [Halobacteriales archaeon]
MDSNGDYMPRVMIVEDEEDVADMFRMWLEDDYDVTVALSGAEALDTLDDEDVDVVLLDRLMPGLSGDEVLERIVEEGFGCRVAMVTAVEPDFDIVEMGFDEYVTKPSSPEELRGTVKELLERRKRSRQLQEYASLRVKQAALRTEKEYGELEDSEEYAGLLSRIDELEGSLEDLNKDMSDTDFRTAIRDIEEERGSDTNLSR